MTTKIILVIGGSYFAGRVFVETLSAMGGHCILTFNRGNVPLHLPGVRELRGNRENPGDITRNIPSMALDAVIDFCAYTPEHVTQMLHNLAGRTAHYILISTASVYSRVAQQPIRENAPKLTEADPPLGAFAEYGLNKWHTECALEYECMAREVAWTALRPAIIFGRYNYAPRESFLFDLIAHGKPLVLPASAPARFSFIWVEDLARIIIHCLNNSIVYSEAYNIAGPEAVSYPDLVETLRQVSGERLDIQSAPDDGNVAGPAFLPFPTDIDLLYDGSKIGNALGFEYTPYAEGMALTWRYYRAMRARKANLQQGS